MPRTILNSGNRISSLKTISALPADGVAEDIVRAEETSWS